MKNLSLTVKIWLSISMISIILYLFLLLSMPNLMRGFFTEILREPPPRPHNKIYMKDQLPGVVIVRNPDFNLFQFILFADGTTTPAQARESFSDSLFAKIKQNALSQQAPTAEYSSTDGQDHIRYVISKQMVSDQPVYQVRFLRKGEEDQFVNSLLYRIMYYVGIGLVISWFASIVIVRYLTRPLVQMEQHVKRIANRNWHDPLNIKQGDEIGQLAGSIESMRQQLVQQEETQQSLLQNISHELKTPVMVIRSYAQAINDGVYPKGDLAGSIQVIDEEGERLERLVKQLLYLNRLEYLATQKPAPEKVSLDKLIQKITQRMNPQRPEITCHINLQPVAIDGDEDTLRVMIENLVDNHLRHAASSLEISLQMNSSKSESILYFWNDGSKIEPHILDELTQPFQKGRGGKFGLGLTIVQRILKMYQGQISLKNERNGVSSTVKIPFK